MKLRSILTICTAACVLTACAPDPYAGLTPREREVLEMLEASDEMFTRLDARYNTSFGAMPSSGTATYNGFAAIAVDTYPEIAVAVGEGSVLVDFAGASNVSGSFSRFYGITANGLDGDYAGTITLANGRVGVNRPNDFNAEVAGSLTLYDSDFTFDGTLLGDFKGTPIVGIVGGNDADIDRAEWIGAGVGPVKVPFAIQIIAEE